MAQRRLILHQLEKSLNDLTLVRKKIITVVDEIDQNKLMIIPAGLSNNIYWQCGHLVTTQASLLYKRTNSEIPVDKKYFDYFAKGTSPDNFDDNIPPFSKIRLEMETMIEYTGANLNRDGNLKYQEEIIVSTGHIIDSFATALAFLAIHEAHHLGSISTLRKLL